jgi:hypothetical protein
MHMQTMAIHAYVNGRASHRSPPPRWRLKWRQWGRVQSPISSSDFRSQPPRLPRRVSLSSTRRLQPYNALTYSSTVLSNNGLVPNPPPLPQARRGCHGQGQLQSNAYHVHDSDPTIQRGCTRARSSQIKDNEIFEMQILATHAM